VNLPADSSLVRSIVQQMSSLLSARDIGPYLSQTLLVGITTLSGMATTFLVIVTTCIYFSMESVFALGFWRTCRARIEQRSRPRFPKCPR
jgi:hypothetical protein